jgi:acyl carrier protein
MSDQLNQTAWTVDRLIAILRDLASQKVLPNHLVSGDISGADTVSTLGIDSIGAVELIDHLEAESRVLLPDDFLDFEDSIENIADRLNSLKSGAANG